jgi:hypothetical protein
VEEKTKNSLRIHSGLILAETLCVSGFVIELIRAQSGNGLSWVYVFEWPLFGGYAIYMWRKLLKDSRGQGGVPSVSSGPDAALDEYNAYLHSVHHPNANLSRGDQGDEGDEAAPRAT